MTKKLFEATTEKITSYKGDNKIVRLYLFSVYWCVFSQTNNLKYLSTLLKVNDLICSLDNIYFNLFHREADLILTTEAIYTKSFE